MRRVNHQPTIGVIPSCLAGESLPLSLPVPRRSETTMCDERLSLYIGLLVACCPITTAVGQTREPASTRVKAAAGERERRSTAIELTAVQAAVAGLGCEAIGDYLDPNAGTNRFRGNAYTLDQAAGLVEIKMELEFTGTVDLFFYVFERVSNTFELRLEEVVSADGTGAPTLYSSGVIDMPGPLDLGAGKQYAIGVAWSSTDGIPSTVEYGDDDLIYPKPFSAGQVDGLIAINQVPPMPQSFSVPTIFTNDGVASMELCLTGACCGVDGDPANCDVLSQAECLDADGEFTALAVTCDEIAKDPLELGCPLRQGACCFDINACLFVNSYACEAVEGSWNEDVACEDASEPCAPRGGCCRPDGSCAENVTVTQCGLLGGDYRGDGVDCDVFPPCSGGACCAGQACEFVLAPDDCVASGGLFVGAGSTCDPNPCVPTGACCDGVWPNAVCSETTQQACAGSPTATYRGDGTTCETLAIPCGRGACCVGGIGCRDGSDGGGWSETFCTFSNSGEYRGDGTTCATIEPRCKGVCCWEAGAQCREDVTPVECFDKLAGSFAGYDLPCTVPLGECTPDCPDPCVEPDLAVCCADLVAVGACCLANETCTDTTGTICSNELLGSFVDGLCRSDGVTACTTNADCPIGVCQGGGGDDGDPCPNGDADCAVECSLEPAICDPTASCADEPNPCIVPEPTGACCDPALLPADPCTDDVLEAACMGATETWTANTLCVDLSPLCGFGACCDRIVPDNPVCTSELEADCGEVNDTWTAGTLCDDLFPACVQIGACCDRNTFTCLDNVEEAACQGAGREWTADTACADFVEPCVPPTGACCNNAACTEETQADCAAAGGNYQGDNEVCLGGLCGACCHLDGTCDDDAVTAECADPSIFHAGFLCENVCAPRGACCLPDGSCVVALTEAECKAEDVDAVYDGDGTVCGDNLCTVGPCCRVSDETCEDRTLQDCESVGGRYLLDFGATCLALDPNCAARICCNPAGVCIENALELDCDNLGDFRPDDFSCDTCVAVGACCLPDDSCDVRPVDECLSAGGAYAGDTTTCDVPNPCATAACCLPNTSCDDTLTRLVCEAAGGNFFDGENCLGAIDCTTGACCDPPDCTVTTEELCGLAGFVYQGNGLECVPDPCGISIVSSLPPDGSIDARQPFPPNGVPGEDLVDITFNGDTAGVIAADFVLEVFPGPDAPPDIVDVTPVGNTVTLRLTVHIPPQQWTSIRHIASDTVIWLGSLPSDVSGDGTADEGDVAQMIACLSSPPEPCDVWECDVDRSGTCTLADVLRVIDLLNGAKSYDIYLGEVIPPGPP